MAASRPLNKDWQNVSYSKRPGYGEREDRISSLPDEIRADIISLLPMQHAVRTCMLSRSWRRIFSSLPKIIIIESDFPDVENRAERVAALIDWTLAHHDDSDVCMMAIKFEILQHSCPLMNNAWVTFAVEHNVKSLQLIVRIDEVQGLPDCLYTSRSLVMLRLMLRSQVLRLPAAISLPNLKRLILENIMFYDVALTETLFTGCPLLEDLRINKCAIYILEKLTISSPKLRSLYMSECVGIDRCNIYLQTPCIECFYYQGALPLDFKFGTMNSISLVVMNLQRDHTNGRKDGELAPLALRFLSSISNVKRLSINLLLNQVLSEVPKQLRQLNSFRNPTSVCLCLRASSEDEEVMLTFLSKFRQLQRLQLIIIRRGVIPSKPRLEWHPENFNLEGILGHLQFLEIDQFEAYPFEIGLATFFLQNAKSLTQVKINIPVVVSEYRQLNEELRQAIIHRAKKLSYEFPSVPMTISLGGVAGFSFPYF